MKKSNSIIIVTAIISIVFMALVFAAAAFIGSRTGRDNAPIPVSASANIRAVKGVDSDNTENTRYADKASTASDARTDKKVKNSDLLWRDSNKAVNNDLVWHGNSDELTVDDLVWRDDSSRKTAKNYEIVMI